MLSGTAEKIEQRCQMATVTICLIASCPTAAATYKAVANGTELYALDETCDSGRTRR